MADVCISDAEQTIGGNLTITGTLTGPNVGIDSGGVNEIKQDTQLYWNW